MSAIPLDAPIVQTPRVRTTERIVRPQQPVPRERAFVPAKTVAWQKPLAMALVLRKLALFGAVTVATMATSSLLGQVLLESARKDAIQAVHRTMAAKAAEAALQGRVDSLTRIMCVENWASEHGFMATDELAKPLAKRELPRSRTLVAQLQ